MPWANMKQVPQALRTAGLTLIQANAWAKFYDQGKAAGMKSPAGFAWYRFKQEYRKEENYWVRRKNRTEKSEIDIPYVL